MKYLLLIWALVSIGCAREQREHPLVVIETKWGDIEVELYQQQAPRSVAAFLSYIDSGLYKRASFYRVLNTDNQPSDSYKAELIQGGIWHTNYKLSKRAAAIPHEATRQTGIKHTDGVLSLARQEPGTAGTEFFICIGNQPGFDWGGENNPDGQGYAAFGKVVKGMGIVYKIYRQPEDEQYFDPPVAIFGIERK